MNQKGSIVAVGHQPQSSEPRCLGGLRFAAEQAKVLSFLLNSHERGPLTRRLVPSDSAIGRGPAARWNVLHVPGVGDDAQVGPSAVQSVTVDMVNPSRVVLGQPQYLTMQEDVRLLANHTLVPTTTAPAGAIAVSVSGHQMPSPLTDPFSISGVNQGVGSNAAVFGAERDTGGIIGAHRTLQRSGVTPPDVSSIAGVSCVDYTSRGC